MASLAAVTTPRILSFVALAFSWACSDGDLLPPRGGPDLEPRPPACQWVVHRADRDGDGYLAEDPAAPESCNDPGSPGYATTLDCDDSDEGAWRVAYVDADGDGYGHDSVCAPDQLPPGTSESSNDCDDSDLTINPSAIDPVMDGTDSDCDHSDGPSDEECALYQDEGRCTCDELGAEATVELDPACADRPDLALLDATTCSAECNAPIYARIANLGGVSATGPIRVRVAASSAPLDVLDTAVVYEDLGPVTVTPAFVLKPGLGAGTAELSVETPDGDCNATNDMAVVQVDCNGTPGP